jgi:hypothetical protein
MGAPPLSAGAVNATVAVVVPVAVAVPIVGAPGNVKYAIICHLLDDVEYASTAFKVVLNPVCPLIGGEGLPAVVQFGNASPVLVAKDDKFTELVILYF